MRKHAPTNAAQIADHSTRAAFEAVELALAELNGAIGRISRGLAPASTPSKVTGSTSLRLAEPPATTETASGHTTGGAIPVVARARVAASDSIPDTEVVNGEAGLYRLSIYILPTATVGGGTITVRGLWEDGSAPGTYFTLGTTASTAGAAAWYSATLYSDGSAPVYVNTLCTGGACAHTLWVVAEYLGNVV